MTTLTRAGLTETGAMKKSSVHINIGCVVWCAGNITPAGTLYCDGSAVSRTTYAELFSAIGTTYGAGDGSTTFNLPDLRGQFVRGTGGSAEALGIAQGDAIRNIWGTTELRPWWSGDEWGTVIVNSTGAFYTDAGTTEVSGVPSANLIAPSPEPQIQTMQELNLQSSRVVPTAAENRPTNYAMRPCIIFE